MDPLSALVGGGLLLAGWLLGRATRQRRQQTHCSCDHTWGDVDPETGVCTASVRRKKYSKSGVDLGYEWVPCGCRHFDGSRPPDAIWTPPQLRLPPPQGSHEE